VAAGGGAALRKEKAHGPEARNDEDLSRVASLAAVGERELRPGDLQLQPGGLQLEAVEFEVDEEIWRDDSLEDHSGWHCVRTDPFPCPADECSFVAEYMTAAHLILVWQERDDPNLLRHAQRAKKVGRNPQVVEYQPPFGPSASYYAWEAAGRPVHGIRKH